jgi:hypothetical protein
VEEADLVPKMPNEHIAYVIQDLRFRNLKTYRKNWVSFRVLVLRAKKCGTFSWCRSILCEEVVELATLSSVDASEPGSTDEARLSPV